MFLTILAVINLSGIAFLGYLNRFEIVDFFEMKWGYITFHAVKIKKFLKELVGYQIPIDNLPDYSISSSGIFFVNTSSVLSASYSMGSTGISTFNNLNSSGLMVNNVDVLKTLQAHDQHIQNLNTKITNLEHYIIMQDIKYMTKIDELKSQNRKRNK